MGSTVACINILGRAAKALAVSEPITTWQNIVEVLYDSFII